ncbi:Tom20 protein [Starmerella bacillaris]|uniref:Tom20 protein n=1 Tax=Starmerella bacillaris TaxID=1247836 RepID=A0AAV5RN93_STABA|nr:Tom20 protein [Starmerella bacillaris]
MSVAAKITTGAVFIGALSYLAYFDYQRRHSPQFRKEIRKKNDQHIQAKQRAIEIQERQKFDELQNRLDENLAQFRVPVDIKERQQMFMNEIAAADQLVNEGENFDAAVAFYRALAAHTNPLELLGLYEKTVQPPEVLDLIRTMIVIRPPSSLASLSKQAINID